MSSQLPVFLNQDPVARLFSWARDVMTNAQLLPMRVIPKSPSRESGLVAFVLSVQS
jgi:hypothetical protein